VRRWHRSGNQAEGPWPAQLELRGVAARRIAAGQPNPLDRVMAKGERPMAKGERPPGAAERVFEGPMERPGVRCEDLWARDRAGG
jgi:hypothetical protein